MAVVTTADCPDELRRRWALLCLETDAAPFHWPGWHRAWRESFGRGRPLLLTAERDGRLVGVLPLEQRVGGLWSPTNADTPEFAPVVRDDHALRALARHAAGRDARALHLRELSLSPAALLAWREELAVALPRQQLVIRRRAPVTDLDLPWSVLEAGAGRGFRNSLRRRRRRAEQQGVVRFETRTAPEAIAEVLDRCFEVEASGWKGEQGTAMRSQPATATFYRAITAWAARCGWARLELLWVDETLVAFWLNLVHRGVVYSLKTGFDEDQRDLAPGLLLTQELLRRACADPGLRRWEWLGGDDGYKLRWSQSTQERHELHAFPSTPSGLLRDGFGRSRESLHRVARDSLSPVALDRLRTVRGAVRRSATTPETRSAP